MRIEGDNEFNLSYSKSSMPYVASTDVITKILEIRKKFMFNKKVFILQSTKQKLEELLKTSIPEWVVGTTYDKNIILLQNINSFPVDFRIKVILHEFVHICMDNYPIKECPLYLYEGIAMYFAGQRERVVDIEKLSKINWTRLNYEFDDFYLYAFNLFGLALKIVNEEEILQLIKSQNYKKIEDIIRSGFRNEVRGYE